MNIVDYIVFAITLVPVVIIGWLSAKRSRRDNTSREFQLAGKGINKLQAGFSMAATDFGGSGLVGAIGACYVSGMSGAWWNLAAAPAFLLVGLLLARRLNTMGSATLPEYLGKRYSPSVKYITCIMHVCASVAALSVQFTVSCTVLHVLSGLDLTLSLIISMALVVLLTSGGLRSVVNAVQLKSKIQDLTYSINDIKERLESNKESIRRLLEENKQLSETIAEKQASLSKLNRNIATIRQLDAMKKSLEIYQQDLSSVELDIIAYSEKVKKTKQSTNKSTSTLYNDYCSEIESVLKKWRFPENVDVTFDAETLDLSIDGKARSDWGKGYRAFILSAMVIGLMRYCFKNNRLHPGFVILDSPLVSLKERKKDESGEWIDDYMEKKMVEDILEEDCLHQVIIFENKDIQYGHQYNYIQFNHEGNVRKGFIPSQEEYC